MVGALDMVLIGLGSFIYDGRQMPRSKQNFYFVYFYISAFLLRLHVPPGIVLLDSLV